MDVAQALSDIDALKAALDDVCDAIMTRAEQGIVMATETPVDGATVAAVFSEIMTLCAFQDLAGQRLSRLSAIITGGGADQRPDSHLLNGPANAGGLDQAAADALFDGL